MAKFNLRDYCRAKLPCNYTIKQENAEETVVLRGIPVRTTPEALAAHAKENGIKAVKFPAEQITELHVGKASAGACSGEVAEGLVAGWLGTAKAEEVRKEPQAGSQPDKTKPEVPSNGSRVTVGAK